MQLTDRRFWENYWKTKSGLAFRLTGRYPFVKLLNEIFEKKRPKHLLEIGGFPGYYCVWGVQKGLQATLLDFVIVPEIVRQLEAANDLPEGSVQTREADLYAPDHEPDPRYGLVVSNGLIEHFEDTGSILQKHVDFLAPGGTLLVTLPNFRGLNGWFQKSFDRQNFDKHFLGSMDPEHLRRTASALGLVAVDVRYSGRFMLWLEDEAHRPAPVRWLRKTIWLPLKVVFTLVPLETRAFSPYIVLTATRPA